MAILVSDSSVLIDLERAQLLSIALASPLELVVPDELFYAELASYGGEAWLQSGLIVVPLEGDEVQRAQTYLSRAPALSIIDAYALALAASRTWVLLTGDSRLRREAERDQVDVHGILWLLELLSATEDPAALAAGLRRLRGDPRTRLPTPAVEALLTLLESR